MKEPAQPLERLWSQEHARASRILRELEEGAEFLLLHIDEQGRPHFSAALSKNTLPKAIEVLAILAQVRPK